MTQRYWDLTERERGELTEEQVRAFLDYELMERGAAKPVPPVMEPLLAIELTKRTVYAVKRDAYCDTSVAFATPEAAHAFLQLAPLHLNSDWDAGRAEYVTAMAAPSVVAKEVLDEAAMMTARASLKENQARKDRNEKAERAYVEDLKAVERETADLWADWRRHRDALWQHRRVLGTWEEYKALAGDDTTAWRFLTKAHPGAAESFLWLGMLPPAVVEAAATEDA